MMNEPDGVCDGDSKPHRKDQYRRRAGICLNWRPVEASAPAAPPAKVCDSFPCDLPKGHDGKHQISWSGATEPALRDAYEAGHRAAEPSPASLDEAVLRARLNELEFWVKCLPIPEGCLESRIAELRDALSRKGLLK